jgi:hypothetical protein
MKSTIRIIFAAAICVAAPALAQTKVGLAHGILSSGSTWAALRSDLIGDGFSVPVAPNLTWADYISSQVAYEFLPFLSTNSIGSSDLLAGHSQGGLVARLASQTNAVKGTITIGTPNNGAPIASPSAASNLDAWASTIYAGDEAIYYGFADVRGNSSHYLYSLVNTLDAWEFSSIGSFLGWLYDAFGLIDFYTPPVNFADMTPPGWSGSSGFISSLNSNIGSEGATYKVAIRMELDGGYYGGPHRLYLSAYNADLLGTAMIGYGYYLWYTGFAIWGALDPYDPYYYDHESGAYGAMSMGTEIAAHADLWHYYLVGGVPNDGIVPLDRQSVSGQEVASTSGYTHLQETNSGNAIVRTWLNTLRSR